MHSALHSTISAKPPGFNLWILEAYEMDKRRRVQRTFREFYHALQCSFIEFERISYEYLINAVCEDREARRKQRIEKITKKFGF